MTTIQKGILKNFYSGSYTATVQIAGSAKAYLENVTVARNIPAVETISERKLAVLFFDKNNPADAVVVAVY
jgi:hypothetical protein